MEFISDRSGTLSETIEPSGDQTAEHLSRDHRSELIWTSSFMLGPRLYSELARDLLLLIAPILLRNQMPSGGDAMAPAPYLLQRQA